MTYTVNSTADPGDGTCNVYECTLREALTAANAGPSADTIEFAIGSGPVTIAPTSNLPVVLWPVTIDGSTQPGYAGAPIVEISGQSDPAGDATGFYLAGGDNTISNLIINRFLYQQILIGESSGNAISGNYLGTNAAGTAVLSGGNFATVRIRSSSDNSVTGNVIGGGYTAVGVDQTSKNNSILSNSIGIGADGVSTIGATTAGVLVQSTARGTDIRNNNIANNGGLGIELGNDGVDVNDANDGDTGSNNKQNFPVLTEVAVTPGTVTVDGSLNSNSYGSFNVELFASPSCDTAGNGEGRLYVGNFNLFTDAGGTATFSNMAVSAATPIPAGYDVVTATATQQIGGAIGNETSEFSACVLSPPPFDPPGPPTAVAAGAGDGQAEVSWLAPASDGGSPLDYYTVSSVPDTASTPFDVPAGTTTATVTGLTNNTSYTFIVTATNEAALTSANSAPSESVTPKVGTPQPEAASADVGANGGLSTGVTATPGDPTNTSVNTPNAGVVTIGEGAMTGTPPAGYTYFGQQIDVSAPDASAATPMKFTFVLDCSVIPAASCSGKAAAAQAAEAALAPPTASVNVNNGSFSPAATLVATGGAVTWHFVGSKTHSVVESTGLGLGKAPLFSSGNRPTGSTYSYSFPAAGQYKYKSATFGDPASMKGTVDVPVSVSATSGSPSTAITVTWASSKPSGFRFDVQYRFKSPTGSYGAWKSFRGNSLKTSESFTGASLKGAGTYQFRSHLENISTDRKSGWSLPTEPIVITAPGGPSHLADIAVFHETDLGGNVQVPDCTGPDGVAQPAPECTWSETIGPDGDIVIVVYTTHNNRWRVGKTGIVIGG